jgi:hypothetical protein
VLCDVWVVLRIKAVVVEADRGRIMTVKLVTMRCRRAVSSVVALDEAVTHRGTGDGAVVRVAAGAVNMAVGV